jgi:hypothetical protein
VPVGLAVALAWCAPAWAQQQQPAPAPARPAPARPAPAPAAPGTQAAPRPATPAAPRPAAPAPAPAATAGTQPNFLGQYGDWGAYSAAPGGRKLCFALAKPTASQSNPAGARRDPAFAFVSTRPQEKVKDEFSVIVGYPLKPNTDANLEIGGASYSLYTQGDGAWIKNAAEEGRLVDAMRKAGDMVIKGTSSRGTQTSDTFSLKGLSQALDRVGQECR